MGGGYRQHEDGCQKAADPEAETAAIAPAATATTNMSASEVAPTLYIAIDILE